MFLPKTNVACVALKKADQRRPRRNLVDGRCGNLEQAIGCE